MTDVGETIRETAIDPAKDQVDAGQQLLAVVMVRKVGRNSSKERVLDGIELLPPLGDRA